LVVQVAADNQALVFQQLWVLVAAVLLLELLELPIPVETAALETMQTIILEVEVEAERAMPVMAQLPWLPNATQALRAEQAV
jgi:hypothetical protein